MDVSLVYFPSAVMLGALHALEPGHAKTLTAAYLIGTKGTKRDAILLGLSVAFTHSIVVIGLSLIAVFLGREAFTNEASYYLACGSSILVMGLGIWLLWKRLRALRNAKKSINSLGYRAPLVSPGKGGSLSSQKLGHALSPTTQGKANFQIKVHEVDTHDHALLSDEEHARAHAADMPSYVATGRRPSLWEIVAFGAAGGFVPCPAAVSVMLLSLSVSRSGFGLILVMGFSIGLAITLVGIGLLVVTGISKLASGGKLSRVSLFAPSIAASMVIISGAVGLLSALLKHG